MEILDVGNNKIRSVGNIHNATALMTLLLHNNELHEIPPEIGLLTRLTSLNIHGNPQKLIRTHVIQRGVEAVLKVLRMRLDASATSIAGKSESMPPPPVNAGAVSKRVPDSQRMSNNVPDNYMTVAAVELKHDMQRHMPTVKQASIPAPKHIYLDQPPAVPDADHAVADMNKLNREIQEIENNLSNPSLTEAKRFALKKQMAKARANLIRLRKTMDSAT